MEKMMSRNPLRSRQTIVIPPDPHDQEDDRPYETSKLGYETRLVLKNQGRNMRWKRLLGVWISAYPDNPFTSWAPTLPPYMTDDCGWMNSDLSQGSRPRVSGAHSGADSAVVSNPQGAFGTGDLKSANGS